MSKSKTFSIVPVILYFLTLLRLLQEAFQLYRSGNLVPRLPQSMFDISQLSDAVTAASRVENYDRVILECSPNSTVPVSVPLPDNSRTITDFEYVFSAEYITRLRRLILLEHFSW